MDDNSSQVVAAVTIISVAKLVIGWVMSHRKRRQYELVGTVSDLIYYPVKSCKGIPLQKAKATVLGLNADGVTDRHWLVTRNNGDFVSQRQMPRMALISVSIHGDNIHMDAPGMPSLILPKHPKVERSKVGRVRVFETRMEAMHCGEEASQWISTFLDCKNLQMGVFHSSLQERDTSNEVKPWGFVALPGDLSAYADFGGYLVANQSSLESLNQRLVDKVTMKTFRPNIVINGVEAFDEDNWLEMRIGEKVFFRIQDPCTRCLLTTVNPETGVKHPDMEPLKTLKKFRSFPPYSQDGPCFGVNAAVDFQGEICVGDPVYILRKKYR